LDQRLLFLVQAPIGLLSGFAVYFSIPTFPTQARLKDKTTLQKLAGIDYAGALTLV
jgi:hypothetical protein